MDTYINNLIEVLDEPIKGEAPYTDAEHAEIEQRYLKTLSVKVKSYYDTGINKNVIEFI